MHFLPIKILEKLKDKVQFWARNLQKIIGFPRLQATSYFPAFISQVNYMNGEQSGASSTY